ncbi:hypothetical protein Tco_0983448 [Tanacetum coccineum]
MDNIILCIMCRFSSNQVVNQSWPVIMTFINANVLIKHRFSAMFVFIDKTPFGQNTMAEQKSSNPSTDKDQMRQIVPAHSVVKQSESNLLFTHKRFIFSKEPHLSDIIGHHEAVMGRVYSRESRHVFFVPQGKPKASSEEPKEKVTPSSSLMTVVQGDNLHIASNNNIHSTATMSAVHHTGDDYYLEKVAQIQKNPQESASVQPTTKRATPKKPTTTTPVKQSKPAPAPTKKPSKHKLPQKIRKGKPSFQLVDEDDEAQQESAPQEEGDDPDLEMAKKMSLETHQEKGEGEGDDADLERAIKLSLDPAFVLPQGPAPADQSPHDSTTGPSSQHDDDTPEKGIHESSSTSDSERTKIETEAAAPKGDKDQDEVDTSIVTSGVSIPRHMNKEQVCKQKILINYHLYHALMEALIADEDAMDKEVADKVKDHKRKHDSDDDEDDDDDEGPSARSNQGRSTKRRRSDSAASGSAKPPPKDDDQSSKKPRESEASASKQHPALTSTGWQITNTREAGVDSSMHRSDPESEHSEQSSDDISMQDEGNDSDMEGHGDNNAPTFPMYEQEEEALAKLVKNGQQFNLPTIDIKEDYTIGAPKPRAVVYRDRNDQRKLMRLNELHKFSDGTLTRVMEKLDQMVKDFHLYEYNKEGMETRKWSEDDKRRSKDFITHIGKRLQIKGTIEVKKALLKE